MNARATDPDPGLQSATEGQPPARGGVGAERTFRAPGLVLVEREFSVPLDYADREGPTITVFARELASPDGIGRPYLLFLQGGPGFEAPRAGAPSDIPWLARALREYRVLMLDQRGTGRSSPVGHLQGMTAEQQAAYLRRFRADAIVRDAEHIRRALGVPKWSVLGQSFGGFCAVTYLSFAPEGLAEVFVTGGLSPIGSPTDDVYRATYRRVVQRNRDYYARYPEDQERARAIHRRLAETQVRLPSGDRLLPRRFQQLGLVLGMSGGNERLHYILEQPFGSPGFLHDVEAALPFARNPIYAVLHEASYADGCATAWSANRLLPDELRAPASFTGEMVYPWMFEDYSALAPLREAAEILARESWPPLYDADRLRRNEVPVAAAIYTDDMYVERSFSEVTASTIRGLKAWVTSEYEHDGVRRDERVLARLIDMVRGRA
jgi:pimeloyl-ACP methyl ester carboxylesterase